MPLFEDIGNAGNVGNLGDKTFDRALRLKELETNQAVGAETLRMAQEKHNIEIKRLQAEDDARKKQEALRSTRINIYDNPVYQNLAPNIQTQVKSLINQVDPVDETTQTHSFGGFQDAVALVSTQSELWNSIGGGMLDQSKRELTNLVTQKQKLEAAGKTDSKDYQEISMKVKQADERVRIATDAYSKQSMLLEKIEFQADQDIRVNNAKFKNDPDSQGKILDNYNKQIDSQKKVLDEYAKLYATKEESNILQNILLATLNPDAAKGYQQGLGALETTAAKSIYEQMPPEIKQEVDTLLANMRNISRLSVGSVETDPLGLK